MTRRRLEIALVLALMVLVSSAADGATIEFRGTVDLLSDRNPAQTKVWVVAPNLTEPKRLPLPTACEVHTVHQPMILVDETTLDTLELKKSTECRLLKYEKLRSCADGDTGATHTGISILGCEVTFEGTVNSVTSHRVPRKGTKPPIPFNESSLNWLFDMDDLLPNVDLRTDLDDSNPTTSSGYPILATRMVIDRGTFSAGPAWRHNQKIVEIELHKTNGSSVPGRAASSTMYLELPGDSLTLMLCPLTTAACASPATVVLQAKPGKELSLRVVNEPFGTKMDCDTHAGAKHRHFFAHFALRKGSESLSYCTWPHPTGIGSGNNPLCSPGDNKGP